MSCTFIWVNVVILLGAWVQLVGGGEAGAGMGPGGRCPEPGQMWNDLSGGQGLIGPSMWTSGTESQIFF